MSSNWCSWHLATQTPNFTGLELKNHTQLPSPGDDEILVELKAGSLNYRDLVMTQGGNPLFPNNEALIPGSDGAGIITSIGSKCQSGIWKVGDKVCVHMTPDLSDNALPTMPDIVKGVGAQINGTLTKYNLFKPGALVRMPEHLSFKEAATLGCSALTAWNALFGLRGRELKEGDWVVVQGSGGVSVAALQIAVAQGAHVVSTTSDDGKGEKLKNLGAKHVLNYRTNQKWGETAKALSPNNAGVDFVIETAGDTSLPQSVAALKTDGIIGLVGMRAKADGVQSFALTNALASICIVRGSILGSRAQFVEMNRFLEEHRLRPALDEKVFTLEDLPEAFRRMDRQEHFSKVVIRY